MGTQKNHIINNKKIICLKYLSNILLFVFIFQLLRTRLKCDTGILPWQFQRKFWIFLFFPSFITISPLFPDPKQNSLIVTWKKSVSISFSIFKENIFIYKRNGVYFSPQFWAWKVLLFHPSINSFLVSGNFFYLLITFANSLDPDQVPTIWIQTIWRIHSRMKFYGAIWPLSHKKQGPLAKTLGLRKKWMNIS